MSIMKKVLTVLLLNSLVMSSSFAANLTKHAKERQKERGVGNDEIERALAKPGVAQEGKNTLKHKGSKATIISDPKSGKVVTVWKNKK